MPAPEPGPLTQEIAGLIRARMARFNVSGVDLADSVGISQSQLSKIARGIRDIDIDLLERLCAALGVQLIDLVTEAEAMVVNTGYFPPITAIFVEENYRLDPPEHRSAEDIVRGVEEYRRIGSELALAADTDDQGPDEDLRTP